MVSKEKTSVITFPAKFDLDKSSRNRTPEKEMIGVQPVHTFISLTDSDRFSRNPVKMSNLVG